jgi:hypothetical protein
MSWSKWDPTDNAVQRTRAWAGLWIIVLGDSIIGGAAMFGMFQTGGNADAARVSILASAFTAVGTMTAAYFGIRAAANTAQATVGAPQPPVGTAGPEAERAEAGQPPEAMVPEATAPEATAPEATAPEQPPGIEEVGEPDNTLPVEVAQHVDATHEDHKAAPTQTGPVDDDPPQTESQHPDTVVASDLPEGDDWSVVPEGEIDEGDQEGEQA